MPSSGCGIFAKSLKRPTMAFRFSISVIRMPVDSRKTSSNWPFCCSRAFCRFSTGGLQREERIFEFVREAAGDFAPGSDAFGLHQALALLDELLGHLIEGFGELADFVVAANLHARAPIAFRDFVRAFGQLLHRARDARGAPPAEHQPEQQADGDHAESEPANAALQGYAPCVARCPRKEHRAIPWRVRATGARETLRRWRDQWSSESWRFAEQDSTFRILPAAGNGWRPARGRPNQPGRPPETADLDSGRAAHAYSEGGRGRREIPWRGARRRRRRGRDRRRGRWRRTRARARGQLRCPASSGKRHARPNLRAW